ncbi:MAG: sialate O-acetylesterase, partial [Phycisphaerae bacterium]|nr:sialate O-acetylesterase [Phycisphaerae bacterium]
MVFQAGGGWGRRSLALGVILAGLAIAQAKPVTAKLMVSPIFGNHMVLQRGAADPVWGTAAPGEKIAVSIDGQSVKTQADAQGKWIVKLAPLHGQGPFVLTIQGRNTIHFHDVLVGEVWVCSGQSNMQYPLYGWTAGGHRKATVARANYPRVRFFRVTSGAVMAPIANIGGKWQVCTPKTAAPFSAVAYYFARDLQRKLHEPVGVIGSYAGGTIIDGWMSMDSFKDPA